MTDYVAIVGVFLFSLTSVPITFWFKHMELLEDSKFILAIGAIILLASVVAVAFFLKPRFQQVDSIIYVYCLFCFTGVLNVFLVLELDGYVKEGFMKFYVLEGEPALATPFGTMCLYWDGFVHYILQFSSVILFCMQKSYREVGLYWSGSCVNLPLVWMTGSIIGPEEVKWGFLLTLPYLILPFMALFKFLREHPRQAPSHGKVSPITHRPVDLMFLIYFVFALGLAVFRGLAVLGGTIPLMRTYLSDYEPSLSDSSTYPKVQALIYLFYFSPYYLYAIDGLLNPGQLWMADWAIIHAGAAAQAQFLYMATAVHSRTAAEFRAPQGGLAGGVFWGINLALMVVPHLFAWRCWRDPDNCGRTYTTNLAQPINRSPPKKNE